MASFFLLLFEPDSAVGCTLIYTYTIKAVVRSIHRGLSIHLSQLNRPLSRGSRMSLSVPCIREVLRHEVHCFETLLKIMDVLHLPLMDARRSAMLEATAETLFCDTVGLLGGDVDLGLVAPCIN